jgi:hypothetical protein
MRLDLNRFHFDDVWDVVIDMLAYPRRIADEELHQLAWRYVSETTQHASPLTGGTFLHRPELFLRSVGAGFCDDRASVLHWIWRALGYNARVMALNGHVVAEVMVGGRWEMYDPDYGIYYLDRKGVVASVEDLQGDPSLVSNPVTPIRDRSHAAYDSWLAALYASADDNGPSAFYSEPLAEGPSSRWMLPPGGRIEIATTDFIEHPTLYAGYTVRVAQVRFWIPPGFSGRVPLPLLISRASGDGIVKLPGRANGVSADALEQSVREYMEQHLSEAISELVVESVGPAGLELILLASPARISSELMTLRLTADNLSGIVVEGSVVQ